MKQLIEITNVPIQLEMKTSYAKLEYSRGSVDLEVSRDEGGLNIKSRPIQLKLDTFEMKSSIVPTAMQSMQQSAQNGRQAAYEATATYAQQGELLLKAKVGQELVTQFAADALTKDVKQNVGLKFLPSTGPDMEWDPGELNIRIDMDKLKFNWQLNQNRFKFTPGDIEITVKQQPDVIIKYIGGPLYVPPSTDPNYQPMDLQA